MRAGPVAVAVVVGLALSGCAAGDRNDFGPPATPATTVLTSTTVRPATTVAPSTTVAPGGAVTLRVSGLTLPDIARGSGLRVMVRSASPRLVVRRRGGAGGVSVCPVDRPSGPVEAGSCVELPPQGEVSVAFLGGVDVRGAGSAATVDELSVAYVAADRSMTITTPARPAGECAPAPCEAVYSFVPGGAGAVRVDAHPAGGRPRLVLTAVPSTNTSVSNRTLATVEGGGLLSIRATVDAGSEARLLHQESGAEAVPSMTAEISWP